MAIYQIRTANNGTNQYLVCVEDIKQGIALNLDFAFTDYTGCMTKEQAEAIYNEVDNRCKAENSNVTFDLTLVSYVSEFLGYNLNMIDLYNEDGFVDLLTYRHHIIFDDYGNISRVGDWDSKNIYDYFEHLQNDMSYTTVFLDPIDQYTITFDSDSHYMILDKLDWDLNTKYRLNEYKSIRLCRKEDIFIVYMESKYRDSFTIIEVLKDKNELIDWLDAINGMCYLDQIIRL